VTLALLTKTLQGADVQVLSATDGLSGLSLISLERPEVVILDVLIPQIDGFELCRRIRDNPDLGRTKVIVMSAVYKGAYFKRDIRDSGADAFLAKPIDVRDLKAKVDGFLKPGGNLPPLQA
jgi:two-component system cell cycle response regulator